MKDKLPKGRFSRALGLSRLGAKVALNQGRALLARDGGPAHEALAEAMFQELGRMKGMPMKIGQMLSYMEGLVPDEHRGVFQKLLGRLQANAEPMDNAVCLEVFQSELGHAPESVFERFDETPIAAASLGQVYRARYEGEEVCVKVQYPGIAEATTGDFNNINGILKMVRTMMPSVDTEQMIADFRIRMTEECDYTIEARYQHQFYELYEAVPEIVIPKVIDDLSTTRILTTRFIEGVDLATFLEGSTQEERNQAGLSLFRLAFVTLLRDGLFHADPHPGNFLLRVNGGGSLGLLDFGCVQPAGTDVRSDMASMLQAAMAQEDLHGPLRKALGIRDVDDVTMDVVVEICRRVLAPILEPQPFQFTQDFAKEISKVVIDAKFKMAKGFLTRKNRFALEREGVMFIVRNLFGLAGIWGQLQSKGDFRAVIEEAVTECA